MIFTDATQIYLCMQRVIYVFHVKQNLNSFTELTFSNKKWFQVSNETNRWADEFAEGKQHVSDDSWVNEFSKLHMQDWVEEFGQQVGEGASGEADSWANAYDE